MRVSKYIYIRILVLQTTVEVTVATTNNNAPVGEISEIAQLINSESSEPNSVVEDGGNSTYYSIYNAHSSSSSSSSDESTVTTDGGNFPRRRRRRRGDRNRHGSRDRCVEEAVLVLIGCKSCMTYFMAEKAVTMECPSCDGSGEIVRFDRWRPAEARRSSSTRWFPLFFDQNAWICGLWERKMKNFLSTLFLSSKTLIPMHVVRDSNLQICKGLNYKFNLPISDLTISIRQSFNIYYEFFFLLFTVLSLNCKSENCSFDF